jgi:hypothetical protein
MLLALQVLGDDGGGSWSSVMCGIDWVTANWNRVSPPIKVGLIACFKRYLM